MGRGAAEVRGGLERWLAATVGATARVVGEVAVPEGNGMSADTFLLDVADGGGPLQRLAVRLEPEHRYVPPFDVLSVPEQGRLLQALAERAAVPVPRVRWCEPDPAWVGAPFLVTERVEGRTAADNPPYSFGGWPLDAPPEAQDAVEAATVEVLAAVHAVDAADLGFLRPPSGSPLRDQVDRLARRYGWARGDRRSELIEGLFAWLDEHWPEEGGPVLCWGDARMGNVLFDDACRPTAVLDWESACLAPRELDVGWLLHHHAAFNAIAEAYGMPGAPDLFRRERVVERYEAASGHRLGDLRPYEVVAALRLSIATIRGKASDLFGIDQTRPIDDVLVAPGLLRAMLSGA